eukprot:scaffold112665_cov69-Phaeocystis_antarctica.AAC.2
MAITVRSSSISSRKGAANPAFAEAKDCCAGGGGGDCSLVVECIGAIDCVYGGGFGGRTKPSATRVCDRMCSCEASCRTCSVNHWPASGARGSPALEPSESVEPQKPSYRPQALPSARCEVQPSLSPGVFSQKYASTKSGRAVSAVGHNPRPAPRILHQLEQSSRMSSTPLRPVSITKWGAVTPEARSAGEAESSLGGMRNRAADSWPRSRCSRGACCARQAQPPVVRTCPPEQANQANHHVPHQGRARPKTRTIVWQGVGLDDQSHRNLRVALEDGAHGVDVLARILG